MTLNDFTPAILDKLNALSLFHGSHEDGEQMCAMEAAAYVAGEPWSDHPVCVCPTISAFMRSWNDGLPDNQSRDRLLKPLIPLTLNTRTDDKDAQRRSYMVLDWLIRVHTPKWLDMVPALTEHAKSLRDMEEICDMARAAQVASAAAWDAAGAAAWDAAGAALKPTQEWLQVSAGELVKRMCAVPS